jgi:hypothetical protein
VFVTRTCNCTTNSGLHIFYEIPQQIFYCAERRKDEVSGTSGKKEIHKIFAGETSKNGTTFRCIYIEE